jgi:hypothetical protein
MGKERSQHSQGMAGSQGRPDQVDEVDAAREDRTGPDSTPKP